MIDLHWLLLSMLLISSNFLVFQAQFLEKLSVWVIERFLKSIESKSKVKLKHNFNTLQKSFFSFSLSILSKLQVSAVSSFFTTEISRTELRLNISFLNNQTFHLSANMISLNLFLLNQMTALKIMISELMNTTMKAAVENIQSVINKIINNMQFQKSSQLFLI